MNMVKHTHEHIHHQNSKTVFKRFKWIVGQSKTTLGFICNYAIA